jgi:hypothetical protein
MQIVEKIISKETFKSRTFAALIDVIYEAYIMV